MRQVDGGEDGALTRGGLSDKPSILGNLIRDRGHSTCHVTT
ncbi:hypothetical protein [Aneurinibacillus thermoaerophilus]|nr:hypothetical protein [Aneurinibacillus thermoaerophilus]MED0674541.1 hypothetical protein [Aneurinibacillus thermoaerophilus]